MERWREIRDQLRRGRNVLLAVVGEASRHSPGTVGAMMWIAQEGSTAGTIGGGAMELGLQQRAGSILSREQSFFEARELHHRRAAPETNSEIDTEFEPSGMICAGRQTNVLYLCRPDRDLAVIESLLEAWPLAGSHKDSHKDSHSKGHKGWGIDDQGLALIATAPRSGVIEIEVLSDGRRRLRQGFGSARRAAILGGGHCGEALATMLIGLGYEIEIFDHRPTTVSCLREQGLNARWVSEFEEAGAVIKHARRTPVVVMTPDVPNDVRAMAGALGRGFPFLGAMGSEAKLAEIFRRLKMLGFEASQLENITAPVGLPIGSRTPQEIAVSVAAQLLSLRSRWEREPGPASKIEKEEGCIVDQDSSS